MLADAAYRVDDTCRRALTGMGLPYMVGITSAVVVWPPGVEPLATEPYRIRGRPPVNVKTLAQSLPPTAWQTVVWREGRNDTPSGRFAALRVCYAGGNAGRARLQPEEWLLVGRAAAPRPLRDEFLGVVRRLRHQRRRDACL